MEKECNYCGETFTSTRPDQLYCSSSHRTAFARKGKSVRLGAQTVQCKICKKIIENPRSLQKYCSQKCRDESIIQLNKMLEKEGLPPVMKAKDLPPQEFVSSGIAEIDVLVGGFPKGRVTEIFGLKSVGKTQLILKILNSLSDIKILYIDTENAPITAGENVEVFCETGLEVIASYVEKILPSDVYDVIVVDSVASMIPRSEAEGEVGETHMGLKARLMSQWMRRLPAYLRKSTTALVFINQQRETMAQYGTVRFTPGGLALGYAASLRLELKSKKADKKETYQLVEVIVEKSRFGPSGKSTQFKLNY